MPYFILAALLVVIDQVVKYLTRANIVLGEHLDFIPGFDLTYIQNTGAAFSILSEHTWILTALSGVVSLILAVMLAKNFFPEKLAKVSMAPCWEVPSATSSTGPSSASSPICLPPPS